MNKAKVADPWDINPHKHKYMGAAPEEEVAEGDVPLPPLKKILNYEK